MSPSETGATPGHNDLERFRNNKKEILCFQQERAIDKGRQRILQQTFQRALKILKSSLNRITGLMETKYFFLIGVIH